MMIWMNKLKAMQEFENQIKTFLGDNADSRPFLCEGMPFECDVFLVGINPATSTDFWKYWSIEKGCDKQGWLEEYKENHNGKYNKTRDYVEVFFNDSKPLKVLETNIYPFASSREADLDPKYKKTELFEYLVNTIKPKLILGHGATVRKELSKLYGIKLKRGEYASVKNSKWKLDILTEHHFSYQWSKDGIGKFATNIKENYL
jgi:hypothetical protein